MPRHQNYPLSVSKNSLNRDYKTSGENFAQKTL